MPDDTLTLHCPAKVNLALSVGAPDNQTRMHPICSWMVATDFGDTLKLTRSNSIDSSYEILIADDAPTRQRIDWPIESDLAFRAHQLMQQHIERDLPINMELIKRIPSGAGLGGGSSDAAGMLVGLNRLFTLGVPDEQLVELGLRLGSDIGFLVMAQLGERAAIVSGFGDKLEPSVIRKPIYLVLILPSMQCGTADVYCGYDQIRPEASLDKARVRGLAKADHVVSRDLFNDLAEAAFGVEPRLGELHQRLTDVLGATLHVSGSGASMFVVAETLDEAKQLKAQLDQSGEVAAVVVIARAADATG